LENELHDYAAAKVKWEDSMTDLVQQTEEHAIYLLQLMSAGHMVRIIENATGAICKVCCP
jgi:hypothetical protein